MTNQEIYEAVRHRVAGIRREIGAYHYDKSQTWPVTDIDTRVYFTIHHSATEGRTYAQHSRFHARPKARLPNGLYKGRGWPGGAYVYASRRGHGILQAWSLDTVTWHCGVRRGNYVAIPGVVEGNFNNREPSMSELLDALAMKIDAEAQLGRRLELKYHNEWRSDRDCPGTLWPKDKFREVMAAYYACAEFLLLPDSVEIELDTLGPGDTNPLPTAPAGSSPAEADSTDVKAPRGRTCLLTLGLLLTCVTIIVVCAMKFL